jgi:hypothetical protein
MLAVSVSQKKGGFSQARRIKPPKLNEVVVKLTPVRYLYGAARTAVDQGSKSDAYKTRKHCWGPVGLSKADVVDRQSTFASIVEDQWGEVCAQSGKRQIRISRC